ncbi:MAG: tetratricopeptide repeat protein [Candidatus Nealsonbacteria bacterium]|nr:tetratricopeptide repeat protein [Candidatus Nealsonbacteria bacterium]
MAKLENVVKENPYNIEARFQLGRLYFNNKRIDDAIGQFQVVVILVPSHSNAHYSLGVAYAAKKEIQSAVQEFEKVLELNPGNPDVMQKIKELKGE